MIFCSRYRELSILESESLHIYDMSMMKKETVGQEVELDSERYTISKRETSSFKRGILNISGSIRNGDGNSRLFPEIVFQ